MMESLVLFDSVVNSRWFMRTSIILFLNKVDLFKQKLSKSPLGNYFPDYSGGNDVNRAAKYLLWRFNQVNRAHLNLYPQYVMFLIFFILFQFVLTSLVSRKPPTRRISGWSSKSSRRRFSTTP
jgi:guanine nucleotide-binding protein subunit alpha